MAKNHRKLIDLTGQVFGRLTVLREGSRLPQQKSVVRTWICLCECGNQSTVRQICLTRGMTKSCGCYGSSIIGNRTRRHGLSDGPEHLTWMRISQRCYNPKQPDYPEYQSRGVCNGWRTSFESFYADMGPRPKGHSIDRPNNDGGYWCGHCSECIANHRARNARWATPTEQSRNRRSNVYLTANGRTMLLIDWAREVGIGRSTIARRLGLGWSHTQAVTIPVRKLHFR